MPTPQALRIVLTGASRGLGRALAEGLIAAGHTVCGCARGSDKIAELRQRWPLPHQWHAVNVASDQQVLAWTSEVLAAGPVDLLINNAALMNRTDVLWNISAEEFDPLVDVNVKGVANCIRH